MDCDNDHRHKLSVQFFVLMLMICYFIFSHDNVELMSLTIAWMLVDLCLCSWQNDDHALLNIKILIILCITSINWLFVSTYAVIWGQPGQDS